MRYYKVYFNFYGKSAYYGTASKKLLKHFVTGLKTDYYIIVEKL